MVIKEQQKELIILVGCGLVLAALGWVFAIAPVAGRLRMVEQQASDVRAKAGLASEVQAHLLKSQSVGGPPAGEMTQHDFIAKMSTLAKESGLKFDSLVPSTEAQGLYTKLVLNLKTRASFSVLIKFLDQLEEFQPVVVIPEISIQNRSSFSKKNVESDLPQVEFTLETYLKKK